jgi:DNA-directed RNA polymerase subunit RPC12/RpoP
LVEQPIETRIPVRILTIDCGEFARYLHKDLGEGNIRLMPRRLPFRRRWRRPVTRRRLPPRLRQAHRLLENGKHLQAALLFQELAKRAEDLKIPRASLLYLQAGRALILGNRLEAGLEQLRHAFSLMAAGESYFRLESLGERTLQELSRLGHDQAAEELKAELERMLPEPTSQETASVEAEFLPGKCEQCGATLHPDEVERLSDGSLACAYCGSRVMFGGSK